MFKIWCAVVMMVLFGVVNVNAGSICARLNDQVKCLTGNDADDLFTQINSVNVKPGKYLILIDKTVAKAMREKFKNCERIKDVSLKVFKNPDETLKEAFQRVGGESYYFIELELN